MNDVLKHTSPDEEEKAARTRKKKLRVQKHKAHPVPPRRSSCQALFCDPKILLLTDRKQVSETPPEMPRETVPVVSREFGLRDPVKAGKSGSCCTPQTQVSISSELRVVAERRSGHLFFRRESFRPLATVQEADDDCEGRRQRVKLMSNPIQRHGRRFLSSAGATPEHWVL